MNTSNQQKTTSAPVPTSRPVCDETGRLSMRATKSKHGATRNGFPFRKAKVGSGPDARRVQEVSWRQGQVGTC